MADYTVPAHHQPSSGFVRAPRYDMRFSRGDAFAADGWQNIRTGELQLVVVGHCPCCAPATAP